MKTPREFIENWYGSKIPEDWDLDYQPLRNVSVSQMESMLKAYSLEVNKELLEALKDCLSTFEILDNTIEKISDHQTYFNATRNSMELAKNAINNTEK